MAVTDIFNRRPLTVGNGFAADSAAFTFTGLAANAGMMINNMSFQYAQPINRIYELQSQKTYYVAGRPQGSGTFGRILGTDAVSTAFYKQYGDVCESTSNKLIVNCAAYCGDPGGSGIPGIAYCLVGVLLNNVGMRVAAQDMLMAEDLGYMFVALEVCSATLPGTAWPSVGSCLNC